MAPYFLMNSSGSLAPVDLEHPYLDADLIKQRRSPAGGLLSGLVRVVGQDHLIGVVGDEPGLFGV